MKLTITKDDVAAAKREPPRRFVASFDATGLDERGVADALRALADQVEAPVRMADRLDDLRRRVAEADPTLVTRTRIPLAAPDVYPVVAANGQRVGGASFTNFGAARQHALFVDEPAEEEWADDEDEDEDDEDAPAYEEDDIVEFYLHDAWLPGLVIDQASEWTYIIEDEQSRRWEVNVACLRRPEEG